MRTRVGPDGKEIRYVGRAEQGIKITVKQKAQPAAEESSAAATHNNTGAADEVSDVSMKNEEESKV